MSRTNKYIWKNISIVILGLLIMAGLLILSLMLGTKNFSIQTVSEALFQYDIKIVSHQIIYDIRLPRAIAAIFVGAFLALSGCVMQVLTRNPLAEPSLIGVSQGAAFALVLALAFFPTLSATGTVIASIIGAGITVTLVFLVALFATGVKNTTKLVLAGVALGMFLSSLSSIVAMYFNVSKDMSFWYAGGFSTINWTMVKLLVAIGIPGIILLVFLAKPLTILHLGEEITTGLGINMNVVRVVSIITVLLLTGASVAVAGTVGFVGLVVPHISRMLVGTDYRIMLPVSAVLGGCLLLVADLGSKFINAPYETPVGVVTAIIGVPFFLYLVRRERGAIVE